MDMDRQANTDNDRSLLAQVVQRLQMGELEADDRMSHPER